MAATRRLPDDPLDFIQRCVRKRRIFWSYHVNMRMHERSITRNQILDAVDTYEILETNPHDKFLPSYLVYSKVGETVFHVLFATDCDDDNVRVITAYRPDNAEWSSDFKTRRRK